MTSAQWFHEVVPRLADMLLRLPCLLENHYENAEVNGVQTGLHLLESQQPGIVLLSQELIGALLACSFFCLFPNTNRSIKHLRAINFDQLFASLYEKRNEKQEHKIKCIIHYFERICSHMPLGNVSFERKVLPLQRSPFSISYPDVNFWSEFNIPLCRLEVHTSGLIEDQPSKALEVDFANRRLGGGALNRGCVQEEIRFMINPELIAGILFLPAMEENEAIEIVGAERFSDYTGYASLFQFCGDYVDKKDVDSLGRHKTRIIAIDALSRPGKRQYELELILRELNKAFCGFLDQHKGQGYQKLFQDEGVSGTELDQDVINFSSRSTNDLLSCQDNTTSATTEGNLDNQLMKNFEEIDLQCLDHQDEIGIATGNWGCGAFGGDCELKTMIQWLAASLALRPFLLYYTFGLESLQKLDQEVQWILSRKWTVRDLWNTLMEYASQRSKGDTEVGFFSWLIPTSSAP